MAVSDTGQQPSSALTALPSSAFHPLTSAGPSLPSEGGGGIHLLYQFCPRSTPLANPALSSRRTTELYFLTFNSTFQTHHTLVPHISKSGTRRH